MQYSLNIYGHVMLFYRVILNRIIGKPVPWDTAWRRSCSSHRFQAHSLWQM